MTNSVLSKTPIVAALLALSSPAATAGEWDVSGSVGTELRTFFEKGTQPGQLDTFQPSLLLEGDVRWQSDNRQWDVVLVPYARLDGKDGQRTHADMREAYVRWTGDEWTVRAGLAKIFWGVTESRHLVDIINQSDSVEDIDDEDKLGQPMVEVSTIRDWGQLTAYVMPRFRKRTFAGADGRLRAPFLVENDLTRFDEGRDDDEDVDFALRYSHYFGDWDVGLSFFRGADREPRLVFDGTRGLLAPYYDDITQVGVDLQYTKEAWLWKFEGIVRDTPFQTFAAAVGGVEYTFYGVTDAGADLGVLVEFQYDGRSSDPLLAPQTIADNDIFIGTRLALNDAEDTDFLGGIVVDVEDGSMSGLVESSRRFGANWVGEIEGRFFMNTDADNLLYGFRRDSHVMLRLTRYF
ncbi:hypothetical protein [Kordiimonas lacus]|uniref:Alginate export n=1 Tax=Kordiimonas lacus TaxID=637679 RepID=A0A1G7BDT5_9PROT|nr:hypothetical protein [Kordiimonas lacus]SDE25209.1 hypothetical protein SAMN04488071_2473 [Kordiimonas lacus]